MQSTATDSSDVILFPATQVSAAEPTRSSGYANTRFNAIRHGVLSRHIVLAHEDGAEFGDLLAAMVAEHQPSGPTETHLVEELAGAIWRKTRVLQAEGATINRGLLAISKTRHDRHGDSDGPVRAAVPFEPKLSDSHLNYPVELAAAIRETPAQTAERAKEAEAELAATSRAAEILRMGGARAYKRALQALTQTSADAWADSLDEGEVAGTSEDLAKHLDEFLLPFCRQMVIETQEPRRDQGANPGRRAASAPSGEAESLRSSPRPQVRAGPGDVAQAEGASALRMSWKFHVIAPTT